MDRFFRELAQHFPRAEDGTYTRRMNWGEYVHFTSGAAGADLSVRPPAPSAGPRSGPISSTRRVRSSPASPTEAENHAAPQPAADGGRL